MKSSAHDSHPYLLDAHRQLGVIMMAAYGIGVCHCTHLLAVPRFTHLLNCRYNKSCVGQVMCLGTCKVFMSKNLVNVHDQLHR